MGRAAADGEHRLGDADAIAAHRRAGHPVRGPDGGTLLASHSVPAPPPVVARRLPLNRRADGEREIGPRAREDVSPDSRVDPRLDRVVPRPRLVRGTRGPPPPTTRNQGACWKTAR